MGGRIYLILGSASGIDPGVQVNGVQIPLNPDLFSLYLLYWMQSPVFPDGIGLLDANGEAKAVFDPEPLQLISYMGGQLSFAWVTLLPLDFASNPVSVSVTL